MSKSPVYSPAADKEFFRRTAVQSKKVNIDPVIYRGGFRF